MFIGAKNDDEQASFKVYDDSRTSYLQLGHGRSSITWNLRLIVESGAPESMPLNVQGQEEGPDDRNIDLSGNRLFSFEYIPAFYKESLISLLYMITRWVYVYINGN